MTAAPRLALLLLAAAAAAGCGQWARDSLRDASTLPAATSERAPARAPAEAGPPTVPADATEFRADFETGDLTQWAKRNGEPNIHARDGRITIERALVRQGSYAARIEIRPEDTKQNGSGGNQRAELSASSVWRRAPGERGWWSFSVYFPPDFRMDTAAESKNPWAIFTQFHGGPSGTSPVVELGIEANRWLRLILRGEADRTEIVRFAPLRRGRWHDFLVFARWSTDSSEGRVRVEYRFGQRRWRVVADRRRSTLYAGGHPFIKQGLYGRFNAAPTWVVIDGTRQAKTRVAALAAFGRG